MKTQNKKEKFMNIKKLIIFITIIIFSLGLLSCNSARSMANDRLAELNGSNDDETADKCFQKIIESLENKDKEGMKNIFSKQALKEANDIDGGIDYIMDFYKGKIQSKKVALQVSDKNDYGRKEKELRALYTVVTDEDTYIVFFINQMVDTKNSDNTGIYMLQIIKKSDREKEFDWGGDKTRCAGIYRPKATN